MKQGGKPRQSLRRSRYRQFMKKAFFSILVILFFSCSEKNGKKANSLVDNVDTNSIVENFKHSDKVETKLKVELFDSIYNSFLVDNEFEIIKEAKGGAGDCYGVVRKYKKQNYDTSVVIDNLNCGDYGFVRNRYLLKNENIFAVKTIKSDWSLENSGKYKLTEIFYYFKSDSVLIKSRVKENSEWKDSVIIENIPFVENVLQKDSVFNALTLEMQSAFEYESLEY